MPTKPRKRRKPTVRQRLARLIKELEAFRGDYARKPGRVSDEAESALTDGQASLEQALEIL